MPQKSDWPLRPFDPKCKKRTQRDEAVVDAVRQVLADWDGDNWSAVREVLLQTGRSRDDLAAMTPHDVRMTFAVGQHPIVVKLGGRPQTTTATLVPSMDFDLQDHQRGRPAAKHSQDFRSVSWFGKDYVFTPTQAACVKVLWDAWENGTPEIGELTLKESAGTGENSRLVDVFRNNPAWGELIRRGDTKGAYRLVPPSA